MDQPSTRPAAPEWAKDLVIYEIATKSFTSPDGHQSGTFDSLRARLPYLQDLGITGIWLTGHSRADARHFFNIWTQYAVIEPDQLDPSLGTAEQFRAMIEEAHQRGIKIFLDVITHGVMASSSLISTHPQWFRGGSWGMVDYDWQGGHTDLDEWWVKLWTDCVVRYGVDGFRLDCDVHRPDLWTRIRQNAAKAGHPIVIFSEDTPLIPGVVDFQHPANCISTPFTCEPRPPFSDDIPGFYRQQFPRREGSYRVRIQYADGSYSEGCTDTNTALQVQVRGFTSNRTAHQRHRPAGFSELHLSVSGVEHAVIQNIVVTCLDDRYISHTYVSTRSTKQWLYRLTDGRPSNPLRAEGRAPVLDLYLASFGYSPSIQLSAHDYGFSDELASAAGVGFALDGEPYVAKGSRSIFGYSFLFTPMVPIFMAGEEFNASFHALPDLSTDLHGGRNAGKGRWLYGAQLDWSELEQPERAAMLEDVRKMLAIRRQERAVLCADLRADAEPRLMAVPCRSDISVPVPYLRWSGSTGILVAGNRSSAEDAILTLNIPVEPLKPGANPHDGFRVTDLWNDGDTRVCSAAELFEFQLRVRRDNSPRGGLAVLKIEAIPESARSRGP